MDSKQLRNNVLAGLISALLCSGCMSKLTISVDVYKGPLINSPEAQLGEAVGLARNTYSMIKDLQSEGVKKTYSHNRLFGMKTGDLLARHMEYVAEAYKGVSGERGIDELWVNYTSLDHSDPARVEARAKLADALFRYGASCEGLGRLRGLPAAVKLHFNVLFAFFDRRELREGIGLEEAGRWIKFLADNAADTSSRTSIARMMQSVTTGHAATMATAAPLPNWFTPGIIKALDRAYWSEINEITVVGAAKTEYVIVKDEIGNWHIKSLIADQDEIVNAVFDGAEGMVGILAAYYGVTASRAPISDTDVPQVSSAFVDRQLQAAKADRTAGTIRTAKLGLQVSLVATMNENDVKTLRKLVKSAVQTYAAQIDGIASEAGP
ncbi:MAG: hypothetical protein O7D91_03600 [Planctomycetota bacterium]|nr:hypothetical protein [Planctomycetota bacterium]